MQLTFRSDNLTEVEGFTDSDYASNPNNRKFTSGYVFTYGDGAWKSTLEDCIALSKTKVEYVGASEVAKIAIWLRLFTEFLANN